MARSPETRNSLILRLPTADDAIAWREFTAVYEPLVYQFARRRGLQDADAQELVQNVLYAVAQSVERWKPDPQRGKFRAWLFRIARNQLLHLLAKKDRPDRASGRTTAWLALNQVSECGASPTSELEMEYRRELFRFAATRVRSAVRPTTWQAFWHTSVLGEPVHRVAQELEMTAGAVYIARCRVLQRLKDLVQQWEHDEAF